MKTTKPRATTPPDPDQSRNDRVSQTRGGSRPRTVTKSKSSRKTVAPAITATVQAEQADHEMTISFGTNCTDTKPTARRLTLCQLSQLLSTPDLARGSLPLDVYLALDKSIPAEKRQRDHEKDGAYLIAGGFTKPGTRVASEMAILSGFVGDLDTGNLSASDVARRLAGYAYIIFSSYSHHPTDCRWRFIVPYAFAIPPAMHKKVYEYFQARFDNLLDKRCGTTNQLWYTPACPPDAGDKFVFMVGDGTLLNVDDIQAAPLAALPSSVLKPATPPNTPRPPTNVSVSDFNRLNSALTAVPADDYDDWIRIGLALHHDLGAVVGYEVWLAWTKSSNKFDVVAAETTWANFKATTHSDPVTIATIIYMARAHGWVDTWTMMDPKLQALNSAHFMSMEGGKTWVYNEYYDNELKRMIVRRSSLKSFKEYHANQTISVQQGQTIKNVDIGTAWHRDPSRRTYEAVVFLPGMATPAGHYNLWRGFGVTPSQGDWSLLQAHIHDVLCDGDDTAAEYLYNWMAYAVQIPHKAGEVAVVLKGERGTGKGKLASMFGSLFGQHALQITSAKHLVGNFNAHLQSCVFLFVDEALWAGDKAGESVLKGLITEDMLVIEKKGQDIVRARNCLHIMMASNDDWVVPAGPKERRFFVLEANSKHIQDLAYFAAIDEQMLNAGGLSAMLYDLLRRDITSFNVRTVPKNTALDHQVLRTLDPGMLWWMDHLGKVHLNWQFQSRDMLAQKFGEAKGTFTGKSSETALGMFLSKVLPKGSLKKVQNQRPAHSTPSECYEFPDQLICKTHLIKQLGLSSDPWA